ncbi:type IV secretory system conjugative DNA transfer family protein [Miniimonas sp. S16]|uniref:type IV secretory system conjugative DNA transfer family protein n=1 Tax=Miniimonas sp. S16 TaxID=2171623 RepID=UPI000D5294FE|nr:TraM recognition domain-containing protein [Miniimonas sp. S16]
MSSTRTTTRPPRRGSDTAMSAFLVLMFGGLALALSFALVVLAIATVTGNTAPRVVELLDAAAQAPSDPLSALEVSPGPSGLIYGVWIVLVVVIATVAGWVWWRQHQAALARRDGRARRRDMTALHRKNAEKTAQAALKRTLPVPAETDTAVGDVPLTMRLGTHDGVPLRLQHEDSVCIIAPARSGKTTRINVGLILDAAGPVVATGTKNDILLLTAVARARKGKVLAFDPSGIANWPGVARPDFVHGCEDPEEALNRAKAWAAGTSEGSDAGNAAWFRARAAAVLACYLHAAAIKPGGSMADVVRWASDFSNEEAIGLLHTSPRVKDAGWAERLRSQTQSQAGETSASLAMTIQGMLDPLASPRILEWLCPGPAERFDPARFLDASNTLYLLTGKGAASTAPLLTMFLDLVVRTAQNVSQTRPGGRLWPPLLLDLEEAANVAPMPTLPEVMSDSGGRGITTVVVCQSLAQMRLRWGREEAETIRANATATLYLPGIKENDLLEELSEAMDRYRAHRRSYSSDGSFTSSREWEQVMTPAQIRRMPIGRGLLFYRGEKGALIDLPGFWERSDRAQIARDLAEAEEITSRRIEAIRSEPHPADLPTQDAA